MGKSSVHFSSDLDYVSTMTVAAVIVAGGSGVRAGGEKPKQYQLLGNVPVIRKTIEVFATHHAITHLQVVIGKGHEAMYHSAIAGLDLPEPVIGGSSRQESCRLGLEALANTNPKKVLIHDAARPFVTHEVISNVIEGLDIAEAIIPGLPIADTMKFAPGGVVQKTVDRTALWSVQTPQGFNYARIAEAHRRAIREGREGFTDDAAVAEFAGMPVRVVLGDTKNRKLTTGQDMNVAEREVLLISLSERPDVRTAQGIDFHIFQKGNSVTLCGVAVPHTHSLKGHSDADVALHALTDAILGSIGEGDIGTHFPPSDQQWRNAPSSIFLNKASNLLKARNGIISNIDLSILAETPKISPHIEAMKLKLSELLMIAADRIAIKATTTEQMGSIGRKEGMAAFAIVTIRLPL